MNGDEEVERIETFYGGRQIDDLVETYGLSIEDLARGVEREETNADRAARDEAFRVERQKENEIQTEEQRLASEQRFKGDCRTIFFTSNPDATDVDFERLYPRIRDEYLLENYAALTWKKTASVRRRYES